MREYGACTLCCTACAADVEQDSESFARAASGACWWERICGPVADAHATFVAAVQQQVKLNFEQLEWQLPCRRFNSPQPCASREIGRQLKAPSRDASASLDVRTRRW